MNVADRTNSLIAYEKFFLLGTFLIACFTEIIVIWLFALSLALCVVTIATSYTAIYIKDCAKESVFVGLW